MSGTVDVRIEFANRENATFERSQWLDGLQTELRRRQIDCMAKKLPAPENAMSPLGPTEYLAIIAIVPGSISMLFDILNYYKTMRPVKGETDITFEDNLGNTLKIKNACGKKIEINQEFDMSECKKITFIIDDKF